MLEDDLKQIGLTQSETKIYLCLLENGVSSPSQIAKGTGIALTNSYHVLQSLKEKNLIEEQKKGKRKVYLPTDPSAIIQGLECKKEKMEKLLPDLRALFTTQKNKPKIKFYDGFEQVKEIYMQSLEAEEVYGIGSTEQLDKRFKKFFDHYLAEFKKRHIIYHDILTYASKRTVPKMTKGTKLHEVRLLPKKFADFPVDILIYGDNVGLISLEDPVFGTVLTNKNLADAFRVMFKTMWESALPPG